MLRALTLSTLFPNRAEPTLGPFVERQTLGLAARPAVEVEVVAPVGLPHWPLSLHPHYAARSALPREEEWKGLRVHRPRYTVWPKVAPARTPAAIAEALLPLLRSIRRRFPFDLIDAEFFWPDGPAAMALGRALGVPFSVKARGADIHHWGARPDTGPQVLEAGLAADGLLAVSEAMKRSMAELGLPEEKIRVHHTGVDAAFVPVERAAAKRSLGIEGPLIVTAGALIPRKGQSFAIEALALLAGATLVLIGDGPDRARLEALARRLGVDGRVRFLGSRPHAELPRWLAAADVTLLPSSSEGLANVWVESLACGTPVVTTDVGGAREAIDRPEAGRLAPRDPAALAAAVRELLDAPPPQGAVRRCADRFSWERNAAELANHLGLIVEAAAARSAAWRSR
jgi:glycosyltransferase involved in cell wall biosynthesis